MAKTKAPKKKTTKNASTKKKAPTGPTELVLELRAPGMDALLRAGLGGLASVLKKLESKPNRIDLPGEPWKDGKPPWELLEDRIVLQFGKPENAREYLKRLFEYAFQIKENESLIDLPSTHDGTQKEVVRAQLQRGLMLTFLQHGQSRKGAKKDVDKSQDIDGKPVKISFRPLTSFKHQTGYEDLVKEKDGTLQSKALDIPGTLFPGASVRHNKYGATKHEGTAAELLAAYFAMIGTLALPVNRGSAVLLVPEVTNLVSFGEKLETLSPKTYHECLISGVGDAALGLYVRMHQPKSKLKRLRIPAVSAYLFRPTVWASQQKSRVAAARIEPLEPFEEKVFLHAQQSLKSRMVQKTEKVGRGKNAKEEVSYFFSHSIVKPLIADNLANRKPWFHNFSSLFTRNDPATGKPLRSRLFFEKEGLSKMVNSDVWESEGQKALVAGVHYALYCQFGKISSEFGANKGGMQNKFQKEFEKWRIQFASSKTADQFRFAICDLMSRARGNKEIQENWQAILPLLSGDQWQHGRDLSLLALASYKGKGDKELADAENQEVA